MARDKSSDFDQSPAKMFMGLFVLIGLVAAGFVGIRFFVVPSEDPKNGDGDKTEVVTEGPERSPDGSLINDPLDIDLESQLPGLDDRTPDAPQPN